ncbi:hypothetical protein BaRGS_00037833 [Batillaria attramentaria]|uniref:Uncharacterized protein n=1 Tax=Batillaria attramentaria TaxID=370345 RepID=A0ABD0J7L1_9CAEN
MRQFQCRRQLSLPVKQLFPRSSWCLLESRHNISRNARILIRHDGSDWLRSQHYEARSFMPSLSNAQGKVARNAKLSKSCRKKVVTYSVEPLAFFTPLSNGHLPPTWTASRWSQQLCGAQIAPNFGVQLHSPFLNTVQAPLRPIGDALVQKIQAKTTGTARATSANGKLLLTCENAPVKGSPLTSMQWRLGRVQYRAFHSRLICPTAFHQFKI